MNTIKFLALALLMGVSTSLKSQPADTVMQKIRVFGELDNPTKSRAMMYDIMRKHGLNEDKDGETVDIMKGHVALDYLEAGDYAAFDDIIESIRNPFNQTSYLSMAASTLLRKEVDLAVAEALAKRTLDLYFAFKDDPKARPAGFAEEDWNRFMKFAYYPYCDTYAAALYAVGKYKEALNYQLKAFDTTPEEAMLPSVERYAHLLVLNDQEEKAYGLLTRMAETGKATQGMNSLLRELYVGKHGDEAGFDRFFADLQKNVVATLKEKYIKEMQDKPAPPFTLSDLEGKTVSLADLKGKVVVIDFWATWCAPCKASFPAMAKMVEKHPEVAFLFIATQEKPEGALERVKGYITENNYPFHVLMDEPLTDNPRQFEALSAYQVTGIPAKVIIDAQGKQRFFSTGFTSDTELMNELEAKIQLVSEL